jgi:cell shape-determining protein MreC
MTTISPNRRRVRERGRMALWAGLLIILFLVVFLLRQPLTNLFWTAAAPLSKAQTSGAASVGNFFANFASNRALSEENARLRAEVASATAAVMDRDLLWSENQDLKARLGRAGLSAPRTLAAVVARPPGVPYDFLIIDAGASAGVAAGDLVSAGGSAYIGEVSEVYAGASKVELFSSPGSSYQALLTRAGTTTLALTVEGQGGGSLMSEVPAATAVSAGDMIVFSSIVPQIAGKVVAVEEKDGSSFKKIFMQLPVSVSGLEFVEVYHTNNANGAPASR